MKARTRGQMAAVPDIDGVDLLGVAMGRQGQVPVVQAKGPFVALAREVEADAVVFPQVQGRARLAAAGEICGRRDHGHAAPPQHADPQPRGVMGPTRMATSARSFIRSTTWSVSTMSRPTSGWASVKRGTSGRR